LEEEQKQKAEKVEFLTKKSDLLQVKLDHFEEFNKTLEEKSVSEIK
jgi:hypothetical protein